MIDMACRAVTPLTIHSCFKNSSRKQDLTFNDYGWLIRTLLYGKLYLTLKLWLWATSGTESDEDESEELTPVTLSEP
ncbi:hypothetical protein TNCV_954151 [Trichonephila clavipes]|nr:hypothetical protein TNCV_954151 [Trichonephila clavipes]